MPASSGGSVVDPSLLRQAADRGVTICFADLDGAEGLWVPEERTVLVSRELSEAEIADVIEHELAHVMIDDQHADLDAGRDVVVGRPPRYRQPRAIALATVGLFVVVGGVFYGVNTATGGTKPDRVAPNPDGPGLTAPDEYRNPTPSPRVTTTRLPDGRVIIVTVPPEPATPTATGSPTGSPRASATATKAAVTQQPSGSAASSPAPVQPTTTAPPPIQATDSPASTPTPTDPVPTSPVATAGSGGDGDLGDEGPGATGTATGAPNVSPPVDGSAAALARSGTP